jgi:hypothetical protein
MIIEGRQLIATNVIDASGRQFLVGFTLSL